MKTTLLLIVSLFIYTSVNSQIIVNFTEGDNINDTVNYYMNLPEPQNLIFNFAPGTYTVTDLYINSTTPEFLKLGGLKTIFQSTTGNMDDVIIESQSSSVFRISKGSVYLRDLTISTINNGNGYQSTIALASEMESLDSIFIENCTINAGTENTDYAFEYLSGEINQVANVYIRNNIINNGDRAIHFEFEGYASNIQILNNQFNNQAVDNIYISYVYNLKLNNNIIELPTQGDYNNTAVGIKLSSINSSILYSDSSVIISNNSITKSLATNTVYTGIELINANNSSNTKYIISNNIIDIETDTNITGLYFSSTSNLNVLHNSIRLNGDSTVGYAIESGNLIFKNNIIETNKYAFVGLYGYSFGETNYNNYSGNPMFYDAYYSYSSYNFEDWKVHSSVDNNSSIINPNFNSTIGNLEINNELLNNTAQKLPEINFDINNLVRNTPYCDMGAKEVAFLILDNDTAICYGANITIDAGIAESYLWNTGATTQTITTDSAGTYIVTIEEIEGGATATDTIIVSILPQLVISFTSQEPNCYSSADGFVVANITNGTLPIAYNWAGSYMGDGTDSLYNIGLGTYYLTVTDANLCNAENQIFINAPTQMSINFDTIEFCGGCIGEIASHIIGGTGSYTYSWSTGSNSQNITDLCTGTYSLTATDANNCHIMDNISITEGALAYISGTIDYSGGNFNANEINVELYKQYTENAFQVEKVDENLIDGTSKFEFTGVYPYQYTFRAIQEQANYSNVVSSYYGNTVDWYNATYITVGCGDTINDIEFNMYELENLTGTGTFRGTVMYQSELKSTGEPVTGAEIYIEQDPNDEPIANDITDGNGEWEVDSINEGVGYKLRVDIPGLDQITTYANLYITQDDTLQSNLNFIVDTTSGGGIMTDTILSVIELNDQTINIKVYPNPATNYVAFETFISTASNIKFDLININGEVIYTSNEIKNYVGDYKVNVDISDYSIGTYLLKFKIGNSYYLKKIIKQ